MSTAAFFKADNSSAYLPNTRDIWFSIEAAKTRTDACIALLVFLLVFFLIYAIYQIFIQPADKSKLQSAANKPPPTLSTENRPGPGDSFAGGSELGSRRTISTPTSNNAPAHEVVTITIEGSRGASDSPAVILVPQRSVKMDRELPDMVMDLHSSIKIGGDRFSSCNPLALTAPGISDKRDKNDADVVITPKSFIKDVKETAENTVDSVSHSAFEDTVRLKSSIKAEAPEDTVQPKSSIKVEAPEDTVQPKTYVKAQTPEDTVRSKSKVDSGVEEAAENKEPKVSLQPEKPGEMELPKVDIIPQVSTNVSRKIQQLLADTQKPINRDESLSESPVEKKSKTTTEELMDVL